MSRLGWRGGLAVGALAWALATYLLLAPSEEPGPASAAPTADRPATASTTRETPFGGVVARLPFVGTLTWRCDAEQRFFTGLTLPSPGASLLVGLDADGRQVWRRRQVNPVPPPKRTVVGPFRALRSQTWTIRYHHKPATLKVTAALRFAAPHSRSQCVVSRASIQLRRTAH
jgi:hypothetical protein